MRKELKMLRFFLAMVLIPMAVYSQTEGMSFWDPAGTLNEGRQEHTATLLSSGQILAAGGSREDLTLSDTEIYDPWTGEWTLSGALNSARFRHTATRLLDGRVLVAGGETLDEQGLTVIFASAEIYDPATATWSLTGELHESRTRHTATLLESGEVLVVGGVGGAPEFGVRSSAELYDPLTGIWKLVGPLSEARAAHTATLLPSGEVLVAGGFNSTRTVPSAELYNPMMKTWAGTGDLGFARSGHTATLLPGGNVLVAGGGQKIVTTVGEVVDDYPQEAELYDAVAGTWSPAGTLELVRSRHSATLLPSGKVLVTGGQSGEFPRIESELYDPATERWALDASLRTNRRTHTATLLPSGQVVVAGGEGLLEDGLASVEVYTPRSGTWREAERRLPEDLAGHTATLLPSGDVLVAGGGEVQGDTGAIRIGPERLIDLVAPGDSAALYRAKTTNWSVLPSLEDARTAHTATLLPSGDVLVVAGVGVGKFLASAELFRTADETWSPAAPLLTRRARHSATLLPSGEVLVSGGINDEALMPESAGKALASAELYSPALDAWKETGSMRFARVGHTATLLASGRVLVAGGLSESQFWRQCEIYDPATGSWSETGRLSSGRVLHTATLLPSGKVLVTGGIPARNAELFDPESGTWTDLGELPVSRVFHTATLLPDGRVLVAGGSDIITDIEQRTLSEVDIYDPALWSWQRIPHMTSPRALHTATLLSNGGILVVGGAQESGTLASAELLLPNLDPGRLRPRILEHSSRFRHGESLTVTGTGLRGDSAASQGNVNDSAVDLPLLQLRSLEDNQLFWLTPDRKPVPDFTRETTTLSVSDFPTPMNPGWHLLTVYSSGLPSESSFVEVGCGLVIDAPPRDTTAAVGTTATFTVESRGGRSFQWQEDGVDIPGATAASYTTPPVSAADSGTTYSVRVSNGCTAPELLSARLIVEDHEAPTARVVSPRGGEFWLLSTPAQPSVHVVTWEMSDNVRICQVKASLVFSDDGGQTYEPAFAHNPDGEAREIAVTFGPGGACAHPGEGRTSVTYHLPEEPPSGRVGSLYKVRLRVTDHAGLMTEVESEKPFSIVQPNNESVKTLILTHSRRLQGLDGTRMEELRDKLDELAGHPQVRGVVVDLDSSPDLGELYALWDEDARSESPDPTLANLVLFGCHQPLPEGCPGERSGVHDVIRDRLAAFPEVENLVLVGDDRVIPFARLEDRTVLLLESEYTSDDPADVNASLSPRGTTVGQALAADRYLSDDPLATRDPVHPEELVPEHLFLPDLNVGRLVETPTEIIRAIATFLSQDGVLDLSAPDPVNRHKVLVSGYDFLIDGGRLVCERWKSALGAPGPCDEGDLAPVDGALFDREWGEDTVEARRDVFHTHLSGNGGEPYLILNPNGHATHHELGVPGLDRLDIQGLSAEDLDMDLAGRVVYAVGCHGGLPVPDSASPADRPADLPQWMLRAGVQAYIANTGYGWGLLDGVGLSERLVELFTSELTAGGTLRVGAAMQRAKRLYFMEAARFDAYDAKTLMQWTLYGFPMYAIRTGISTDPASAARLFGGPPSKAGELPPVEHRDGVMIARRISAGASAEGPTDLSLPRFLTRVETRLDFSAEDVYAKFDARGEALSEPGCPADEGCYYRSVDGRQVDAGRPLEAGLRRAGVERRRRVEPRLDAAPDLRPSAASAAPGRRRRRADLSAERHGSEQRGTHHRRGPQAERGGRGILDPAAAPGSRPRGLLLQRHGDG